MSALEKFAKGRTADTIAALWGFAEATLFFIVPDVFLTFVAITSLRSAARAALWALAGALAGGLVTYVVASQLPRTSENLLEKIPAIDAALIENVADQIEEHGVVSLFLGPLKGIPYKIYAVEWAVARRGLRDDTIARVIPFLLISVPARLIRFLLTSALAAGLTRFLRIPTRVAIAIHLVAWTAFYAFYFAHMSS